MAFDRNIVAALWIATSAVVPADETSARRIEFAKGSNGVELRGEVTGHGVLDYKLVAKGGQTVSVNLEAGTPSINFNVLPPGDGAALHVGSSEGNTFIGRLPVDGDYTIRTYLMGNARDAGLTVPYMLKVSVGEEGTGFDRTLELQGVSFRVVTTGDDAKKVHLRVTPEGLEVDNSVAEQEIAGTVTGAEVADLNADGSPEVYVYSRGPGLGGASTIHAWSSNHKRSMSPVQVPELGEAQGRGYRGGDEFSVVENVLVRRFPVHATGGPTGKTRQIQYRLEAGEAGWLLKVDRVTDF